MGTPGRGEAGARAATRGLWRRRRHRVRTRAASAPTRAVRRGTAAECGRGRMARARRRSWIYLLAVGAGVRLYCVRWLAGRLSADRAGSSRTAVLTRRPRSSSLRSGALSGNAEYAELAAPPALRQSVRRRALSPASSVPPALTAVSGEGCSTCSRRNGWRSARRVARASGWLPPGGQCGG